MADEAGPSERRKMLASNDTDAEEQLYQYEPLLPGQIRILVLEPGREDDELCGRLEAIYPSERLDSEDGLDDSNDEVSSELDDNGKIGSSFEFSDNVTDQGDANDQQCPFRQTFGALGRTAHHRQAGDNGRLSNVNALDHYDQDMTQHGRVQADHARYKAISYAWGEPIFSETLKLSGGMLKITTSLAGALRRFRNSEILVSLWADAVCIDQTATTEKNHQVELMGGIYRCAEEVLVWLGEAVECDAFYFWILPTLARLNEAHSDADGYVDAEEAVRLVDEMTFPPEGGSQLLCPCCNILATIPGACWDDLLCYTAAFWDKTWFKRLWVVQELRLSSRAVIWCGSHHVPATSVEATWSLLSNYFIHLEYKSRVHGACLDIFDACRPFYALGAGLPGESENAASTLLGWLLDTWKLSATNLHDRLYAIRGICDPLEIQLPLPDYCLPVNKLWRTVSTLLLTSPHHWTDDYGGVPHPSYLLILAGIQGHELGTPSSSWVLDMNQVSQRLWLKHMAISCSGLRRCSTAMLRHESLPCQVSYSELLCRGQIVGRIAKIAAKSALNQAVCQDAVAYDPSAKLRLVLWFKSCHEFWRDHCCDNRQISSQDLMGLLVLQKSTRNRKFLEKLLRSSENVERSAHIQEDADMDPLDPVMFTYHQHNEGAQLAVTTDSRFSWVPPHAAAGDCLCLLYGAPYIFVMRPCGNDRYRVIGDAHEEDMEERVDLDCLVGKEGELQDIILI